MPSNSFGNIFRVTTWGESHGDLIGAVIDGCPAGIKICDNDINIELAIRAPGRGPYTTRRKEADIATIDSGVFEGYTTGAPIAITIRNTDANSSSYDSIKHILRPGHANFTYQEKYGVFDYRGGGRSSARETAMRVAVAAVAKKLLNLHNIKVCAYLDSVGNVRVSDFEIKDLDTLKQQTLDSPIFCPDHNAQTKIIQEIVNIQELGDSVGGSVSFVTNNLPTGLGDPIYEKLDANLAHAMISIPASRGFEIGSGFASTKMRGSTYNDQFVRENHKTTTSTNNSGGTLGGISNGMPIWGRVAFKPTSSIAKTQTSITLDGDTVGLTLPNNSRHDPCVAIRAVPVVEAMCVLVLADALLMNRSVRI